MQNEVKRIDWLNQLNNFVCDYFENIQQFIEMYPKHKNYNKLKAHYKDSLFICILVKGKIFFEINDLRKAIDPKANKQHKASEIKEKEALYMLNQFLKKNSHSVDGEAMDQIKLTEFRELQTECLLFFEEYEKTLSKDRKKYLEDLGYAIKMPNNIRL